MRQLKIVKYTSQLKNNNEKYRIQNNNDNLTKRLKIKKKICLNTKIHKTN